MHARLEAAAQEHERPEAAARSMHSRRRWLKSTHAWGRRLGERTPGGGSSMHARRRRLGARTPGGGSSRALAPGGGGSEHARPEAAAQEHAHPEAAARSTHARRRQLKITRGTQCDRCFCAGDNPAAARTRAANVEHGSRDAALPIHGDPRTDRVFILEAPCLVTPCVRLSRNDFESRRYVQIGMQVWNLKAWLGLVSYRARVRNLESFMLCKAIKTSHSPSGRSIPEAPTRGTHE